MFVLQRSSAGWELSSNGEQGLVSKSRIRYAMKSLKERGILVREGSAKSGKWLIKK
jgi:predicted HTH transcriptional regulator